MAKRMAKKSKPPRELIEGVENAIRRIGDQGALTRLVIAEVLGLHKTDLQALDFLHSCGGSCTAGVLSRATGLSSGATTALIDRLVKSGYAAREPDPNDRRIQIVRIPERVFAGCEAVYAPVRAEMNRLWSNYSVKDLEFVEQFLTRSAQLHADCLKRLRTVGHKPQELRR